MYDSHNNYRKIFSEFLQELNFDINLDNLKGAFTPIGIRKPIIYNNIFYVGGAVELVIRLRCLVYDMV